GARAARHAGARRCAGAPGLPDQADRGHPGRPASGARLMAALGYRSFWYVVARSQDLAPNQVVQRKVLGEWLAVFRDESGPPAGRRDRCMHRNAPLPKGRVRGGQRQGGYPGWVYDGSGPVVAVPAEGAKFTASKRRCAVRYAALEHDGFVYV